MRRHTAWFVLGLVLAMAAGLAFLALPHAPAPAVPASRETLRLEGRFGHVTVVRPSSGPPTSVALLLADGPADEGRGAELASALAEHGALVLGVDANAYLRSVEKGERCAYLAGDLEVLSQGYQQHAGLPAYVHPVVVGDGPGAALAYAALAQAPPGTFRGTVSVGFVPELETSAAFCPGSGLERARTRGDHRERLEPVSALPEPWVVLAEEAPDPMARAASDFARTLENAHVVGVPAPGPLRGPVAAWKPTLLSAYDTASVPLASEQSLGGLPVVEVPTSSPGGDTLAFFVSGDGGWASMDRTVSKALVDAGIPVVGLNSLHYFWKRRTPEDTAADVARALRHYLAAWDKQRVVLVGYSRGADVVPAIAAGLPPDLRQRVTLLALIAPGKKAEFEVHVTDIFGGEGRPTHPTLPDILALGGTPVLCIYASDEVDESLCPMLFDVSGARLVMLQGGHHFNGDFASVSRAILQALTPPARESQSRSGPGPRRPSPKPAPSGR